MVQVLVGPSKQLKEIIQTEHNIVKNPKWLEANQSAMYKCGQGFELWSLADHGTDFLTKISAHKMAERLDIKDFFREIDPDLCQYA